MLEVSRNMAAVTDLTGESNVTLKTTGDALLSAGWVLARATATTAGAVLS